MTAIPVVFSTGSLYPFGLERVYAWISEAGFDGVEVMMDERWDTHQEAYLKGLVQRYGVPILAFHAPLFRGAWRLGPGETLVRVARLAARIEVPVVVAHPPPRLSWGGCARHSSSRGRGSMVRSRSLWSLVRI
jgi:sugar phosphate isomerase/epimerase